MHLIQWIPISLKAQPGKRISRDEIREVYRQGEDAVITLVEGLLDRIESLESRLSEVESQLKKNSRNSHQPPSSDGFKKRTKSLRQKSHRPSGGQPTHPGKTLEWSETVDAIVVHRVEQCHDCGHSLAVVPATDLEARQIHDLPALSLQVIEHHCEEKLCPHCGCINHGSFPSEVSAPIQYGPRLKGLSVYLMDGQLLPSKRVQHLLNDVYSCHLSEGSLYRYRAECYNRLEQIESQIKLGLLQSAVTHFDETGFRIMAKPQWLHVACNSTLTYYFPHPKRGRDAMNEMAILPEFKGISVHDGWSSYRQYGCHHALCNAHHLRELQSVVERFGQTWARKMMALLSQMNQRVRHRRDYGLHSLPEDTLVQFEGRYRSLIASGLRVNRPKSIETDKTRKRGRLKQSPPKNLLDRLNRYQSQVLAFITDFRVPFDNNQAERDLRMMKVKQKISGAFRSEEGAKQFCRIRGYLSTLRKQGNDVLKALQLLFMGIPTIPNTGAE